MALSLLPSDWLAIVDACPDGAGADRVAAALGMTANRLYMLRLRHPDLAERVKPKLGSRGRRCRGEESVGDWEPPKLRTRKPRCRQTNVIERDLSEYLMRAPDSVLEARIRTLIAANQQLARRLAYAVDHIPDDSEFWTGRSDEPPSR